MDLKKNILRVATIKKINNQNLTRTKFFVNLIFIRERPYRLEFHFI